MSMPDLPDFHHALALAQGNLDAGELSECHGVLCGLLVRHPDCEPQVYFTLLSMLEIVDAPGAALQSVLTDLHFAAGRQLADQEMRMAIWLPDDEESIEDRTAALAQWCNGFLAGLGSGDDGRLDTLSAEAAEALADLQQIALAAVESSPDDSEDDLEEEEMAFMEIEEYVRITVMMLREDMRGPAANDSIH